MENIRFSIIVPCYNVEPYIRECVESVLNQTYTNWELLLVDDESTDRTFEVICGLAKSDERICAYTKRHGGLPHTRNYALQYASGDYVSLLDGDDYFAKDHLTKVAEVITCSDSDMIIQNSHTNFTAYAKQKVVLFPSILVESTEADKLNTIFAGDNFLPASAVLTTYKKKFLDENSLRYEEKYKCSEDLDFFLRAISKNPKISFAYHEFYFYRQDNNSAMTKNMTGEMLLSRLSIYKKWIEFYDKKKMGSFDCIKIQKKLSADLILQMRICFELKKEDHWRKEAFCFFKENRHLFQYNAWKQSFFVNYYVLGGYRLVRQILKKLII